MLFISDESRNKTMLIVIIDFTIKNKSGKLQLIVALIL